MIGVGDGNRTRNRRSHSPMLYQVELLPPQILIIAITRTYGSRYWAACSGTKLPCLNRSRMLFTFSKFSIGSRSRTRKLAS